MNTKNILVSFLLIASVLLLTATASAAEIANSSTVKINGIDVSTNNVSVVAGDTITVKVEFTSNVTASDVKLRAEIEGDTEDSTAVTSKFDVEAGKTYVKTLTLEVPADFDEDELSNELTLTWKLWNSDDETEEEVPLNVQRESYDVSIKSITTSNIVEAGESMSVSVVLRNLGYNNADDVYVTVSLPELGIAKQVYFGDIVTGAYEDSIDADDDDTDTVTGTIVLNVPYSAKSGVYTLQVDVETDDSKNTATKEITIDNGVSDVAIKSGSDLILLNPTNKLTVYTVKYLSSEEVVVVPAESSKTVTIGSSNDEFDVSVYSGEDLVSTVKFSGSNTTDLTNPVFVLTVVLAVVFLVLLVVLVVLLTKKPQKAEEFGESYY